MPVKNRCAAVIAAALLVASMAPLPAPATAVLWAWERPEDLRFVPPGVTVAVLAGTVRLSGAGVAVRPRLRPALVAPGRRVAGVVHLEVDRAAPVAWTAEQRRLTAAMALGLLRDPAFNEAQVDFEVRASERQVLLDVLADVRAGLPAGTHLSMTALASWCATETWIDAAPVDEIVPMLFRMGPAGPALLRRLAAGGDFRVRRCRTSVGIATDQPPDAIPPGRRIWMFNPAPWTPDAFSALRDRLRA
jgi:hypothetical protein